MIKLKPVRLENAKIHNVFILVISLVVLASFATMVLSLAFSSSPSINGGAVVYTTSNLTCSWVPSDDVLSMNVSWYKDDSLVINEAVFANYSTMYSSNTSKGQEWTCEVILSNSTESYSQNVSVNISNSFQTKPYFYSSGIMLLENHSLHEDTSYTLYINSTDADSDVLSYRLTTNNLCTLEDEDTGETSCLPTHAVITGSSNPSAESNSSKKIVIWADDNNELVSVGNNFTFILVPVNDQATFLPALSNKAVVAETSWSYLIVGYDEEANTPLIFNFSSDINANFSGLLVMNAYNSTAVNITFDTSGNKPSNIHAGTWSVFVNVTDSSGYNATRNPAQSSFLLTINTVNHAPSFASNFSNISGIQNDLFTYYFYANDSDATDILSFNVTNPSQSQYTCPLAFPWSIENINNSALNASSRINNTLNNSHVVCRYGNLSVRDNYGGVNSTIVFFNITNVNDAPVLNEMGLNGNLSSLETYLYASFSYLLNGTDIDNLTYDAANTAALLYFMNDTSIFSLNSSTGLVSGTPSNLSFIGNWSINVTVSDGIANFSRTMNISIIENSAPVLNISNNSFSVYQNTTLFFNFSSYDADNESMYLNHSSLTSFNSSLYNFSNTENVYAVGRTQFWILNISRSSDLLANSLVGLHRVYINISDGRNSSVVNVSTGEMNFTVLNLNDAPFFDMNQNNLSDTITFGTVIVNRTFSETIYATDYDFFVPSPYAEENLSFSYHSASSDLSQIDFSKIPGSNVSALLNFSSLATGNQSLILVVSDSNGSNYSQNVSFEVYLNSSKPIFHMIKPYFNETSGDTETGFGNVSQLSVTEYVDVSFTENITVVFDAIVSNDSSASGNNLTFYWYANGVLNAAVEDAHPGFDSNFTYGFNFFSSGIQNITLEAVDSRYSSSNWTWFVNVSDVNRPPVYIGNLENLTVNLSTTFLNYFSYRNGNQRFYDPDEDFDSDGLRSEDFNENTSLTYAVQNTGLCSFATFSVAGDDLSVVPTATGLCDIWFTASDADNETATSDVVRVSVVGANPVSGQGSGTSSGGSTTRTQVVTVPLEEEVDVPAPIKILAPGQVDTYANKTIEIPIRIKNTWKELVRGVTLSGIALNATLKNEENATLVFSNTYFSAIPVGGEMSSILSISNYRTQGPFEITVFAKVNNPEFTDSATILINSLEQTSEGDDVRTKVTFAKDMLSENPECRELNELLDRAERAINELDYSQSLNLVNAVINGCKFLMNKEEITRRESPSIIQTGFDFVREYAQEIAIGAGVLTAFTMVAYAIAGVRKIVEERSK